MTARLVRYSNGSTVKVGDELVVDGNLPVEFIRLVSGPWGDDESGEGGPGDVQVKYSWGETATVNVTRVSCAVYGAGEDGSVR